jgi:hypothetical protein
MSTNPKAKFEFMRLPSNFVFHRKNTLPEHEYFPHISDEANFEDSVLLVIVCRYQIITSHAGRTCVNSRKLKTKVDWMTMGGMMLIPTTSMELSHP